MPDWVEELIDMDDYVDYLKAPVGTWDGKTYRVSIDGDCHTFAYRTDYLRRRRLGRMPADSPWVPTTWQKWSTRSFKDSSPARPIR
jgi:multiple sugar transport system substrate-binding protein